MPDIDVGLWWNECSLLLSGLIFIRLFNSMMLHTSVTRIVGIMMAFRKIRIMNEGGRKSTVWKDKKECMKGP
jgi:hypothetical protein